MKKIYYNGIIRTMGEPETVQAVLTDGMKISAAGSLAELMELAPDAIRVDLEGHTMQPAFIDAHSHLSSYAMSFLQVALEECCTFDEIAEQIASFIKKNKVKAGAWIIAKGYNHNALTEKAHPGIDFLNYIASENPLVLQHKSGHMGVFNSLALAELGITVETLLVEGGRIGIKNGKLTGYLEENAFIEAVKKVPLSSMADMAAAYNKAQKSYAAHGITTIQEGMMVSQMLPLYQYLTALEEINDDTAVREIRPVMIHAQLLGTDQLSRVKSLGIIPSFFVAHVYHWGDTHIQNFGFERASKISPTKSALDHDILFTFHQDTPVIEPDMLETIWCAVNRITKAGVELGKGECIDVTQALKAVLSNLS